MAGQDAKLGRLPYTTMLGVIYRGQKKDSLAKNVVKIKKFKQILKDIHFFFIQEQKN